MTDHKPHIAWVIPGGLGTGKGNIGVPVMEGIVTRLAKHYRVTVFQLFPHNKDYQPAGFEIVSIVRSNFVARAWSFVRAFRKTHQQKRFVAVHGFWVLPCGLLALVAGKLFGVRSIVSVLGGDGAALKQIGYGRLNTAFGRWLTFFTLRYCDEAVVLTKFLAAKLSEAGFRGRQLTVIPWGVNNALFAFREKAIGKPVQFLHVANFHLVKNQEMLLRAFSEIRKTLDAKLLMIGEGVDEPKVYALIDELHLRGSASIGVPVPYQQLVDYYHNADILLHTSYAEGQSEVVTEAMSCGVLVCGTRVGLMYDLPACCTSVDINDVRGLADAVVKLLDDPARQHEQRHAARTWARGFDIDWTVQKYQELYGTHGDGMS